MAEETATSDAAKESKRAFASGRRMQDFISSFVALSRKRLRGPNRPRLTLSRTSAERLAESHPLRTRHDVVERADEAPRPKTMLYLAYGSNLCAETFRGSRGIMPLSCVNIQCPELRLTFDLPGVPYTEPCFANTGRRDPVKPQPPANPYDDPVWTKGLIGVVYEVTPEDYAHIIATEGGGASYQDILVTCYPLEPSHGPGDDKDDDVPDVPTTPPFLAHTLFAPYEHEAPLASERCAVVSRRVGRRLHRPSPTWAQASPRYLKLLRDGAEEHALPATYKRYLGKLQGYEATSVGQQLGAFVLGLSFLPFIVFLFLLMRLVQDKKGRAPPWIVWLSGAIFEAMWSYYDYVLKPVFGEGERTVEDKRQVAITARRNSIQESIKRTYRNGRAEKLSDEERLHAEKM
jgi:hypothetical protein